MVRQALFRCRGIQKLGLSLFFLGSWVQIGGQIKIQQSQGPEDAADKDPRSRVRLYFELLYEEVMVSTQPNQKKQWADKQVTYFLEEIQTDLHQLEASTYSLKDEVASLQVSPEGQLDGVTASRLFERVGRTASETKDLRRNLSDHLFWSGQLEGFKADRPMESLEDLRIAVQQLSNYITTATEEIRIWLFPEDFEAGSVVTVEEASQESPLIKLLKAEFIAREILLFLDN